MKPRSIQGQNLGESTRSHTEIKMDTINATAESEARRLRMVSLSKGVDLIDAEAVEHVYLDLFDATFKLVHLNQVDQEFVKVLPLTFLQHYNILLPAWIQFTEALSVVPASKHGHIRLMLSNVQLDSRVKNLLLHSFRTAPLKSLTLANNQLGSDGFKFAVNVLAANNTLETLYIDSNRIESEDDAVSLVTAAKKHRSIEHLFLLNCGLGMSNVVVKAIVPALYAIDSISLEGNSLGSYGVNLMAKCLAKNPTVRVLSLNDNLINDNDAVVLSMCLKTNTNLRALDVTKNPISQVGIYSFLPALINGGNPLPIMSLNEVSHSNHTCLVIFGEENHVCRLANHYVDSKLNRIVKLMSFLLSTGENYTNMRHLDDMPVEIMPRVLAFMMEHLNETHRLNGIFMLMREWSLPLLYTSSVGPEPRRSERVRKNRVITV